MSPQEYLAQHPTCEVCDESSASSVDEVVGLGLTRPQWVSLCRDCGCDWQVRMGRSRKMIYEEPR